MEQNKVRTYILYAVGEILLVVIGILIALQVNNWNEGRKLSDLEISYYESFVEDLQSDSLEYVFKIENARYNNTKILNILDFINNDYDMDDISMRTVNWRGDDYEGKQALVMSLAQAGFVQFLQVNDNTITDIRSTGNIKLLGNEELKDQILFYYNRDNVLNQWWESYLPVRTDIDNVVNGILPPDLRVGYLSGEPLSLSEDRLEEIIIRMKKYPELEQLAIGMYHIHWRLIWNGEGRIQDATELLESVRREIQHLTD
ncbi:MAG: DUF6090 family protein [Balneolaceae bacterium]|nr:DUF6090 family protein [Balneolaceae bacterium]